MTRHSSLVTRYSLLAVALALAPSVAEAHGIYVGGLWVDETGVLVPAVILMILVLKLSGKEKPNK